VTTSLTVSTSQSVSSQAYTISWINQTAGGNGVFTSANQQYGASGGGGGGYLLTGGGGGAGGMASDNNAFMPSAGASQGGADYAIGIGAISIGYVNSSSTSAGSGTVVGNSGDSNYPTNTANPKPGYGGTGNLTYFTGVTAGSDGAVYYSW
jgi:hypothetical protein